MLFERGTKNLDQIRWLKIAVPSQLVRAFGQVGTSMLAERSDGYRGLLLGAAHFASMDIDSLTRRNPEKYSNEIFVPINVPTDSSFSTDIIQQTLLSPRFSALAQKRLLSDAWAVTWKQAQDGIPEGFNLARNIIDLSATQPT